MINETYGSVKECAEHFGVSRQRINYLISKGRLGNCMKVDETRGAVWYIPKPFVLGGGITTTGRPPKEESNE